MEDAGHEREARTLDDQMFDLRVELDGIQPESWGASIEKMKFVIAWNTGDFDLDNDDDFRTAHIRNAQALASC